MARGGNKEDYKREVIYMREPFMFYPEDIEKANLQSLRELNAKRDEGLGIMGDECDLSAMSRHKNKRTRPGRAHGPPRPRPKCKPRPTGPIPTVAAEPDIIGGTGMTGTNSCGAR